MLLNKIPAHRSRLAGHEVEDVIQYRVSPYYGVEQWLVKWVGWRLSWEDISLWRVPGGEEPGQANLRRNG